KKSKYSNYKKSLQTYIETSKEEIKKLKNNKTRAIFFNNLALIYEGLNVPSQAENLYQLALINHKNETIYFNYGLFLYEHNEFKKAQKQFAHLKDTKHLIEMADILMSSYYLQVGSLNKAFALIWDNNYLFFEAERLNNLGIYYLMKSNFSEAIHLFSQSLDKKDSIITTNNLMATLYYKSYSDESRLDFTKLHRSLFIKKSDLIWPTKKINITSQYGWRPDPIKIDWNDKIETMDFHNGIDLSGTKQDTVFAISAGIIESVKTFKGGGKTVYIQHKDSSHSVYMHLSKILVAEKEKIQQGSPIGIVGNTGISTAPHLHLGIYDKNWNSINPITVLPQIDTFE
ncbi:MAG: peptidoglycan DD-metalloendopeptidase family protein, partial [Candidatus Cloacimonadota bacterium]|nr:peptidoglycan DD-metalloendopeptidase family protein [Candidatus Cloacimonadota bacterium]